MKTALDRIVGLIALIYGQKAELVVDISAGEVYLFFNGQQQDLEIYPEEVDCLIMNDIIELDGGCNEEGR